jgi:VanZ family protein
LNLRKWVAPIIWTALILTLGTSLFSYVRTTAMFDPWISRLMPRLGPAGVYQAQVLIRRSAHVIEYAILFLVLNLGPLRGRPVVAFFVCIAVASLDESMQMLTPARSGTIFDVAEDSTGATIMMVLAMPHWDHLRHLRPSSSNN